MSRKRVSGGQQSAKRRRTNSGQAINDGIQTPQSQTNAPSASALSTRRVLSWAPAEHIPSLAAYCIHAFAENLQRLSHDEDAWKEVKWSLKALPDALVQRVFAVLRHTCPTLLQHGFIVAYFLRGSSIVLSEDLPGVGKLTISAIGDMSTRNQVRELELTEFSKIADPVFAATVSKLPSLRKLNLRGCSKVAQKTMDAVAKHCPLLEILNLNYTAVTPILLSPVLLNCKHLDVLKVAGIPNWTDATVSKLLTAITNADDASKLVLPNLRSLKLRQTPLADAVVNTILAACPSLQRLDLSFTLTKHPILPNSTLLEKLVLTSTKVSSNELVSLVSNAPKLKSLAVGAMGGVQGSTVTITNSSAMTLSDEDLRSLTEALAGCLDLESVSLVGNTKLGLTGRRGPDAALTYFIKRVGRRCKRLNLAGISSLRSADLEGLANPDGLGEGPSRLVNLNLNNTSADDLAAPFISSCIHLETLEIAGTKLSSVGLFPIVDACEKLEKLDLTSCRGVKLVDRRRFFKVWEEEWKNT